MRRVFDVPIEVNPEAHASCGSANTSAHAKGRAGNYLHPAALSLRAYILPMSPMPMIPTVKPAISGEAADKDAIVIKVGNCSSVVRDDCTRLIANAVCSSFLMRKLARSHARIPPLLAQSRRRGFREGLGREQETRREVVVEEEEKFRGEERMGKIKYRS